MKEKYDNFIEKIVIFNGKNVARRGGVFNKEKNEKMMRLIILPQLIRLALPGLSNLWLILLKETALVSAIGLTDILRSTGIAARVSKELFFFFFLAFLIYLVLSIISSLGLLAIERLS